MNARVRKKGKNYYIVMEWTERGERKTKSVSVRKRLGLDRPALAREANALRDKIMTEYRQDVYIEPSEELLKSYLHTWLEDYARTNLKPSTYNSYKRIIDDHLIPGLGQIAIGKLRPGHLKKFYALKQKEGRADGKPGGLSARTVRYIHTVLQLAMKSAHEEELTSRIITQTIKLPPLSKPKIRYWEWEDALKFLANERKLYVGGKCRYYPLYALALSTGMRRGELLGLKWEKINFKKKQLSIVNSLIQIDGTPLFQESVKTEDSERIIDLSDAVICMLKDLKIKQAREILALGRPPEYKSEMVFTASNGNWVIPSNADASFRRATRRAGVPDIGGMHSLRHTYATRMLELGLSPKYVQARLGHADIAITLNTYSHVTPKASSNIATITDDIF